MKPDPQERPDFEKAAEEYFEGSEFPHTYQLWEAKDIYESGANHGYDLSSKRIEELEAVINNIRGCLYNRDTDDAILHEIDETLTEAGFPWQPED